MHSLLSSEETRSVHLNIWQPGITKQGEASDRVTVRSQNPKGHFEFGPQRGLLNLSEYSLTPAYSNVE